MPFGSSRRSGFDAVEDVLVIAEPGPAADVLGHLAPESRDVSTTLIFNEYSAIVS